MKEIIPIVGRVTVKVKRAKTGETEVICDRKENLLTTGGRDWIHGQVYDEGTTDEAKYIALTSNSDAASAADTVVTGEITTGGLARAAGTYDHTASGNETTITKTFTSSGSHTGVQKAGLLTASSSGTLVHENTFSSVNLESSDELTVTWTITAG